MADLWTDEERAMRKEIFRLRGEVKKCNSRLNNGRSYLMGVEPSDITVEDALEAFGWTRDGMDELE